MLAHVEVLGRVGRGRSDADLEAAKLVQLHALSVLQGRLHGLHQFRDHGDDVTAFQRAVALHRLGQLVGGHKAVGSRTGIPLALGGRSFTLVLIQFVLY